MSIRGLPMLGLLSARAPAVLMEGWQMGESAAAVGRGTKLTGVIGDGRRNKS